MNPDIEKINLVATYIIDNYEYHYSQISTNSANMISSHCSIPTENLCKFFFNYSNQFNLFGISIEENYNHLYYNGKLMVDLECIK